MCFEVIGAISSIQTIAVGMSIRDFARLEKRYGRGRWRQLKGIATVRLDTANSGGAERATRPRISRIGTDGLALRANVRRGLPVP